MHLSRSIKDITEEDLLALVNNEVSEDKFIEYKKELKISQPSEKKEFLKDVTAFANASGGHLVFGIEEKEGLPVDVCGMDISDVDAKKSTIENILRVISLQGYQVQILRL